MMNDKAMIYQSRWAKEKSVDISEISVLTFGDQFMQYKLT